jgi:hypothetical protein
MTPHHPAFMDEERSVGHTSAYWSEHYNAGIRFRQLGDVEKSLLVEQPSAVEGGRAPDACCSTGVAEVFRPPVLDGGHTSRWAAQ